MLKLYGQYLAVELKSRMEYRVSFFLSLFMQFASAFTTLFTIRFLLARFGSIGRFTDAQVLFCFSVSSCSFKIAECFFRGFDTFSGMLANGKFDRMLVRPRSLVFQVTASRTQLDRIGYLVAAIGILLYALAGSGIDWTLSRVLVLVFMLAGGVALFAGVFVIYAGICFFTLEGLECMTVVTFGGVQLARYPLSIYGREILMGFTFVLPLACAQYWPFLYLCGFRTDLLCALSPLACFLFLIPCGLFWRFGLHHYQSTGS